jgi:NADPH2 dehydrogenase
MSTPTPKLFQPFNLNKKITLSHRVVFPPLTRFRATRLGHVPINPMVKTYYEQRSRIPGTLLITEATFVGAKAGGALNVPGIWNKEQIAAWKEVCAPPFATTYS